MQYLGRRFVSALLALGSTGGLLLGTPLLVPSAHALEVQHQAAQHQAYSQAELDRMLAPIALYPDGLLSQVLMAATYPLEVVEAARWTRSHPGLRGDEAVRAVQDRDWDPSVKSLVAFPNILQRMDENLDWTRSLGDAFLEQEPYVMDTVQQLRQRARAAGTLVPDERLRVLEDRGRVIIEPVRADTIYVPYYDPRVVYGPWWWPSYQPVHWAPWPGYVVVQRPRAVASFYFGPAIPVSVGFFFGGVDWHRRHVEVVRVNNYYVNRTVVVREAGRPQAQAIRTGRWQHDPTHRRGVVYVDPERNRRHAALNRSDERADRRDDRRDERREDRRERDRDHDGNRDNREQRPIVSNQPDRRFDSRNPEIIRQTRPAVSSAVPPNGNPSPARQQQLEQQRERREERREASQPSPARQQQLQQERDRERDRDRRSERTPTEQILRQAQERHEVLRNDRRQPEAHTERKAQAQEARAERKEHAREARAEKKEERKEAHADRKDARREAREDRKERTAQR